MPTTDRRTTLGKRLFWFAVLWVGSLMAVGAAAYALRGLLLLAQ
ncbi:hypothetical protein [Hyphobacterium sp. SN044]|nr:hypothetical protein [Hyphobacterium sp. SN044]